MSWLKFWTCFVFFSVGYSARVGQDECSLPDDLVKEIKSHQDFVNKIIAETTNGSYTEVLFNNLSELILNFGQRKSGTKNLELAVSYLQNLLSKSGLKNRVQCVTVPLWLRGTESAYYIRNKEKRNLKIMGLGSTPCGEVFAPLMVVKDFEELEKRKKEVVGKIVLFNAEFKSFPSTVIYRNEGPSRASKFGAVGSLVRSVTPFSIGTIHVGMTKFSRKVKPIPAAAITLEDADILNAMLRKGESILVKIKIRNFQNKRKVEKNLIGDIVGRSENKSYVIISGHIDSWDVGQGAVEGGGALLALHSLLLLKALNVEPPKRTLRSVLWTGEEMGYYGVKAYIEAHKKELLNWTAAFESAGGLFEPLGFSVKANNNATCILKEIVGLYSNLNTTEIEKTNETFPSDISMLAPYGIPLMEPLMKPNNYFWFHHTEGDSLRVMNSTLMDQHLALITGTAYILANLTQPLPKD